MTQMPSLETGMPNHKPGFSLIEILVVLVILSLVMSIAVLQFGDFGQRRRLKSCLFTLKTHVLHLEQEAILNGVMYRIQFIPHAYQLKEWVPGKGWSLLKTKTIAPFSIKNPPILIQPTGEISPFQIKMSTTPPSHPIILTGQANGNVDIEGAIE